MQGFEYIIPQILVLLGALQAIFAGNLPYNERTAAKCGVLLSLAAAVVIAFLPTGQNGPFGSLLVFDDLAKFSQIAIAVLTAIWLLWTSGEKNEQTREAIALALFSALGAMFLAQARELITVIICLELSTLPAYVLIGYKKNNVLSLEGALKYFLLSMLTTLVTLFGFSYLYGLTGTTHYSGLSLAGAGTVGLFAITLALVGLFAKLSATPFHFWTPDAYEGTSSWLVSFVSTVPKIGGAIAIARLVNAVGIGVSEITLVVGLAAAASMILGNLGALLQTDMRRLMAYSGIAHAGYLLVGITVVSDFGMLAAVLYAIIYAIATMGVMFICAEEGPKLSDLNGLVQRRPAAAWGTVVLLLSLIGIPPLAGFFGKFYLFATALSEGQLLLVVIAVVMSVVSAGYYLRIVYAMFFAKREEDAEIAVSTRSPLGALAFALCVCLVVVGGLGFGLVLGLFR